MSLKVAKNMCTYLYIYILHDHVSIMPSFGQNISILYFFTFLPLFIYFYFLKLDIVRKLFIFNLTYLISILSILPIACKHP